LVAAVDEGVPMRHGHTNPAGEFGVFKEICNLHQVIL
jgi:hypothetical protein